MTEITGHEYTDYISVNVNPGGWTCDISLSVINESVKMHIYGVVCNAKGNPGDTHHESWRDGEYVINYGETGGLTLPFLNGVILTEETTYDFTVQFNIYAVTGELIGEYCFINFEFTTTTRGTEDNPIQGVLPVITSVHLNTLYDPTTDDYAKFSVWCYYDNIGGLNEGEYSIYGRLVYPDGKEVEGAVGTIVHDSSMCYFSACENGSDEPSDFPLFDPGTYTLYITVQGENEVGEEQAFTVHHGFSFSQAILGNTFKIYAAEWNRYQRLFKKAIEKAGYEDYGYETVAIGDDVISRLPAPVTAYNSVFGDGAAPVPVVMSAGTVGIISAYNFFLGLSNMLNSL